MAYARTSYSGDGSTQIYTVPFPYLSEDYVEVRVGGVLKSAATDYTWLTSSTIQLVAAPASNALIIISRNTPKDSRLVNYQDGNILKEETLDLDSDQAFHVVQEALDALDNAREIETFVSGVGYTAGVSTSLVLAGGEVLESSIMVLFDGVFQQVTEYSIASGVLTFTSAIPTGVSQIQVSYAVPLTGGVPDGSVVSSKIANGNVTTEKMADEGVTAEKLDDGVFNDLTAVTAATGDHVVIADASDSGNKKKTLVSSILSLIDSASTSALGLVQLATSVVIKAGTNALQAITPASLLAAQGFTARYTSGNQTITSGGSLSLAHGLTRSPILVNAWLVNTTTELGYGVGSKVSISTGGLTTDVTSNHGISLSVDASLVIIRYGSNANVFFLTNASTGALALATNGNWRLVIETFA